MSQAWSWQWSLHSVWFQGVALWTELIDNTIPLKLTERCQKRTWPFEIYHAPLICQKGTLLCSFCSRLLVPRRISLFTHFVYFGMRKAFQILSWTCMDNSNFSNQIDFFGLQPNLFPSGQNRALQLISLLLIHWWLIQHISTFIYHIVSKPWRGIFK